MRCLLICGAFGVAAAQFEEFLFSGLDAFADAFPGKPGIVEVNPDAPIEGLPQLRDYAEKMNEMAPKMGDVAKMGRKYFPEAGMFNGKNLRKDSVVFGAEHAEKFMPGKIGGFAPEKWLGKEMNKVVTPMDDPTGGLLGLLLRVPVDFEKMELEQMENFAKGEEVGNEG